MMRSSRRIGEVGLAARISAAALFSIFLANGTPARSQSVTNGARTSFSVSPMLDTARSTFPGGSELVSASPQPVSDGLRHLPATRSGWRMNGELGMLQWPVYLADREVSGTRHFRLGYRSSASVLPDASILVLTINDVVVGRAAIASPAGAKPVDFEIPPDLLRRGFNDVRLSVDQRHRVDCSLDATYELWTEVLPAASGFVGSPLGEPIDLNDLAALRPRTDGAMPIEIVLDGKMKPRRVDQVLLAAQAIALTGRFQMPIVHFGPRDGGSVGVRLLVGTTMEVASRVNLPADRPNASGPMTFLSSSTKNLAPVLVVTGSTEDDLDAAIAQLTNLANVEPIGTAPGQRAVRDLPGRTIFGGERLRLADLGFSDVEFSGRFFRRGFDVALPPDFFSADYANLIVDLAGGYAPGLNSDAQVSVEINGRNGANVALPKTSGDVFRHNEIVVPLRLLRPGSNRIEIVAQLPQKSDASCDHVSLSDNAKRFLLLGSTEIRFPAIARLGQTPDLQSTLAGGLPYASAIATSKLYLPAPDRESLSAAVTLAVRLAVAAGHTVPFALTLSLPKDGQGPVLLVSPAKALDPDVMRAIELDPDAVRRAWEGGVPSQAAAPALAPARVVLRHSASEAAVKESTSSTSIDEPALRAPAALSVDLPEPATTEDVVDRWANRVGQRSILNGVSAQAAALGDRIFAAASPLLSTIHSRVAKADSNSIDTRALMIAAQGYRTGESKDVVTIVTAPDSTNLLNAVERQMNPLRWSSLRGRLSVVDASGDIIDFVEASHVRYSETQPRTFGNARLIVAGWFSLNPMSYVLSALLLAGLLALVTLSLVRNVGRRSK